MKIIEKKYNWNGSLTKRNKTNYIVLHHMAGYGSADDIHRIHLNQGWSGIGYHFFVQKDGNIYTGRPIDMVGAHTSDYNSQAVGICFEGNYETDVIMPDAQKKSGQELITYLKGIFPKAQIKKHRDFNATACPGRYFPFEEIKKGVQEMTLEKAIEIVKIKAGLEQQTIDFMLCYKYGEELITKLAKAMEG